MPQHRSVVAVSIVLAGLLGLVVASRDASRCHAEAHDTRHQTGSVCPGFVVLPNGFAVLSREVSTPGAADAHVHHGNAQTEKGMTQADHGPTTHSSHGHAAHAGHPASASQSLLGHQHGEAIKLAEGMLCVPLASPGDTAWMAISRDKSWLVMAEAQRGALTHNSRDNEAFSFTIMQPGAGKPLAKAQVRLLVRMPQHDRHMPGGHGPANDPEVQGLVAEPDATGRYTVQTVDFSMAGPWLFEVQVQQGTHTFSAYFAASVTEQ
jgi:hypothetical protein